MPRYVASHSRAWIPCLHNGIAGLICTLIALNSLSAQENKTVSDETIILNPFVVNAKLEEGYRASNSVSGSRVDTLIKELPFALQAFTNDFITDLNPSGIFDVVKFSPGVTSTDAAFTAGNSRLAIRGFDVATNPLRNGFTGPSIIDTANTQRVEVVKGPASFLYGVIAPGGLVNVITKRPEDRNFGRLSAQYGTDNYYRTTVDLNSKVNDNLSYRLVGMFQNDIEYWDSYSATSSDVAGSIKYKATPYLTLVADYEHYRRNENGPLQSVPNTSAGGVVTGYAPVPRTFNYTIPSDFRDTVQDNLVLESTLNLGQHWTLRGAWAYYKLSTNFRASGGGGTPAGEVNPPGSMPFARRYNETGRLPQINKSWQGDAVGSYRWGQALSLRILAGAQYTTDYLRTTNRQVPVARQPHSWNLLDPMTWDRTNPYTEADYVFIGDRRATTYSWGIYGGATAGFFNDRLLALVGGRRSHVDSKQIDALVVPNVSLGTLDDDKDTPQAGVLFKLTPAINVYASYSESFVPATQLLRIDSIPTNPAQPISGKGKEVGLKTSFLGGRVSSTLSVFDIRNENIIQTITTTLNGAVLFNDYQTGLTRARGVEFDTMANPMRGVQVYFSYSYVDAYIEKNPQNPSLEGKRLASAAKNLANIWARYDFQSGPLQGWHVKAGSNYTGQFFPLQGSTYSSDPYVLYTASFGRTFKWNGRKSTLTFEGKNISDKDYKPSNAGRGRPRFIGVIFDTTI